jgi:DNA repair protein RecN (Recombination protein N)
VLHELHIAGLGVIDDLDLALHPGLNVLTGETGAGKTMVTTGLTLALGARAAASLVRDGAKAARVQARFDAPDDADDWAEDGEVILARTVSAEGKSTARISGQLATATTLASLGEHLVEVHGQHQAQRLLSPVTQTAFLDRFAGDEHLVALAAYREAFDALRQAADEHDRLREAARDRERELDLLAYQVREIEGIGPQSGESAALAGEETRLAHVERLIEHTATAGTALAGDDDTAGDAVSAAAQALAEAAELDPAAGEVAARARGLAAELAELARDVRDYREALAADPQRLQQIRERTAELKGLQRKYGETDEDVIAYLAEASERLSQLSGADERLAELAAEVERRQDEVEQRGAVVTTGRSRASADLADAVGGELEELGMPGAVVQVALEPQTPPGAAGFERVELRFAAGPGQSPAPLAKTASGGERCWRAAACWPTSMRSPRWCSTRSMPGSVVRPDWPWGGGWRGWRRTGRCSSSRTCRRSRASPTGTSAWPSTRAWPPSPCWTTRSASPSSHACSPEWPKARARCLTPRNCSTRRCGSRPPSDTGRWLVRHEKGRDPTRLLSEPARRVRTL